MPITEKLNFLFGVMTISFGAYSLLGLLCFGIEGDRKLILASAPLFVLAATVWVLLP